MKLKYLVVLFFISSTQLLAQDLINVNPDPKGEPWYVGKLRKLTEEDYRKIEQTPKLKLPPNYQKASLPTVVDNSLNKYFRPIFNQTNGCCGQASGVGYNFTYAINFARDLASNTAQNQYPTHYTYNILNGGADNGSFYFDGWEVINANGCPNVETYGGMYSTLTIWMSGYDKYYSSMQNRTLEVFTIDVSTVEGLKTLKAWMNDQLNGSSVGGLANFSAGVTSPLQGGNFKMSNLPSGTPEQNKVVITSWDVNVNHAMTFVGYNDEIRYDFNGDGKYTNNIDIDGNGILDLRDFEIGGLIMVNSWGTTFGNSGKAYVPYKLLAEPKTNGGIGSSIVHVVRAKTTYTPKITLKATITHTSREKLRISAGVSANPSATIPDYVLQVPIFNYQGGDYNMKGGTSESDKTIEIGLDITPLLGFINSNQEAKFFLFIAEKDPGNLSAGSIGSFSIYDYTNGGAESICAQTNVPIANNDTTYLTINKAINFNKVQISTQTLPDAAVGFPYKYTLTAENGTSPYTWDFIANFNESQQSIPYQSITNSSITPSSNDDGFADITLPFSFPFYDKTYSKIKVSTDGSILFGEQFEYVRDFSGLSATRAITAYGSDLMIYPEYGDGIWYKANNDSITIRWKISKYDNSGFDAGFSTTLFPSGLIKFNYGAGISNSTDWIAGISMGNGVSYNLASISGLASVSGNKCLTFTPQSFPEGLSINNKSGELNFTPKEVNKTWTIKARVTDYNKISSTKNFSLFATTMLTFSCDTLRFNSASSPDPWLEGKNVTITNSYSQPVTISSIDMNGFGWYVGSSSLSFPYTINAGGTLNLNIKLKDNFAKSNFTTFDSLKVKTNNTTYHLPIKISSSIYSTNSYPITFSITNNLGAISGATITINNISGSLTTNSTGTATISLINGTYSYTVTYSNHNASTGTIAVNGASQTINVFLSTMDIDPSSCEAIRFYPNPFSEKIMIKGVEKDSKISLFGLLGNCINSRIASDNEEIIETNDLPSGIYFISVTRKNGQNIVKKLIKR